MMHWVSINFDWIGMRATPFSRIALLSGASLVLFAALYFGMLSAMGFKYAYFRKANALMTTHAHPRIFWFARGGRRKSAAVRGGPCRSPRTPILQSRPAGRTLAEIDEHRARAPAACPTTRMNGRRSACWNRLFLPRTRLHEQSQRLLRPGQQPPERGAQAAPGHSDSLAVVYLEMAEQLGIIEMRGVSFPGHFLLRVSTPDGDVMLRSDHRPSASRVANGGVM